MVTLRRMNSAMLNCDSFSVSQYLPQELYEPSHDLTYEKRQALLLSLVGSTLSNTNLRNHEVFARRDLGPNTAQTAKLRSALKPTL